jgi:two-component system nitrate/nitrite response regulator NarL
VHVLICDDHALLADSLAQHLRSRGHTATAVSTAAAALAALRAERTDVCVLDLWLEDDPRGGLSSIPLAREASPGTAVVLLSAALAPADADAALAAGAHAAADKSISLAALERIITLAARDRRRTTRGRGQRALGPDAVTQREREVLKLVAEGLSNREVGDALGISVHTVRSHLQSARRKLSAHNRVQVVAGTWSDTADG